MKATLHYSNPTYEAETGLFLVIDFLLKFSKKPLKKCLLFLL